LKRKVKNKSTLKFIPLISVCIIVAAAILFFIIKIIGGTLNSDVQKDFHLILDFHLETKVFIIISVIIFICLLCLVEGLILSLINKKQIFRNNYDELTTLWSRTKFEREAEKLIRLNPQDKFMLIETDIKQFKFINQNYSEEKADELILYYASVLEIFNENNKGILCRGFADHFYLFFKIKSVRAAMKKFTDDLARVNNKIKSYEIPFFPKFGISFLIEKGEDRTTTVQTLIGHASFAKSTVKDHAFTQYAIYNTHLVRRVKEEQYLEDHMQEALEKHEFFVVYQPKISLTDEKICGGEALVRWNNPKFGIIGPDKFIPLFERNGFIKQLDFFVYEEVFKFIQNQINLGQPMVPISVNMSRNHDKAEKFVHDFIQLFSNYSIPPEMIELEIIERSFMNSETLVDITEKLHKHGFKVAMDDFGTGESSLNLITKVPVDTLKFDRSFLTDYKGKDDKLDDKSKVFIKSLIGLSKNLKKGTIFEGVETEHQRDFLKSVDCDSVQGFLYSKPLTVSDFIEYQKKNI